MKILTSNFAAFNLKALLTLNTGIFMLFTLTTSAQQFSKADQAVFANYPITVEKLNQYLQFEKGFAAAKAAESKYASLTPPSTLDEKLTC